MQPAKNFIANIKSIEEGYELTVSGITKTGSAETIYKLEKNDPQGFNPKVLLLTISPVPTEGGLELPIEPYIEFYKYTFPYTEIHIIERAATTVLEDLNIPGTFKMS
jgi:hypothetical protein